MGNFKYLWLVFARLWLHEDGMHRRRFIALVGAAITAARTMRAQQKAMSVVGYLSVFSPPANLGDLVRGPAHQGLSEAGFIEGQNMVSEYRWAENHYDRLPAMAADLVSRKVDVIVTIGGTPPALAAKSATSTIPIVFTGLANPVGKGLVASLARPGGNITGFSNFTGELTPKRALNPQNAGKNAILLAPIPRRMSA
jgi:putative ABC transport system substrate-binding protein